MSKGTAYTITGILGTLRDNGYSDVVDRAIQTRNRNEMTRLELQSLKDELLEKGETGLADDVQVLIEYSLGWTSALRRSMEIRVARHRNQAKMPKPKRIPGLKEPINYELGDPVKVMFPD